jgi:hypothetical protein
MGAAGVDAGVAVVGGASPAKVMQPIARRARTALGKPAIMPLVSMRATITPPRRRCR